MSRFDRVGDESPHSPRDSRSLDSRLRELSRGGLDDLGTSLEDITHVDRELVEVLGAQEKLLHEMCLDERVSRKRVRTHSDRDRRPHSSHYRLPSGLIRRIRKEHRRRVGELKSELSNCNRIITCLIDQRRGDKDKTRFPWCVFQCIHDTKQNGVRFQTVVDECERLTKQSLEFENIKRQLSQQLDRQQRDYSIQLDELRQNLEDRQTENDELTSLLKEATQQTGELSATHADEICEFRRDINQLKQTSGTLEMSLQVKTEANERLSAEKKQLLSHIKKVHSVLRSKVREFEQMHHRSEFVKVSSERKCDELFREKHEIEIRLREKDRLIDELRQLNVTLRTQLSAAKESSLHENDVVRRECDEIVEKFRNENDTLQSRVSTLEGSLSQLEDDSSRSLTECQETQNRLNLTVEKLEHEQLLQTEREDQFQEKLQTQESVVCALKEKERLLETEIQEKGQVIRSLREELDSRESELREAEHLKKDGDLEIQRLKSIQHSHEIKLDQFAQHKLVWQQRVQDGRKEIEHLREVVSKRSQVIDKLKRELQDAAVLLRQQATTCRSLERQRDEEREQHRERMEESRSHLVQYRDQVMALKKSSLESQSDVAELRREEKQNRSRFGTFASQVLLQVRHVRASMRDTLRSTQQEMNQLRSFVFRNVSELGDHFEKITAELQTGDDTVDSLERRILQINDERREDLEDQETTLKRFQAQISRLKCDLEQKAREYSELEQMFNKERE